MFEFNPELMQGDDDQEAGDDVVLYSHQEEGEGEEGEREDEGRDITDIAGYSDELLPPPPPPQSNEMGSNNQTIATAGKVRTYSMT